MFLVLVSKYKIPFIAVDRAGSVLVANIRHHPSQTQICQIVQHCLKISYRIILGSLWHALSLGIQRNYAEATGDRCLPSKRVTFILSCRLMPKPVFFDLDPQENEFGHQSASMV